MKQVTEYFCEICSKRYHKPEQAEECETKHKGDLCFQNISSFKDVLDQLFLKLNMAECECKCEMRCSFFYIELPNRLRNIPTQYNLPYWMVYHSYSNNIAIDIQLITKLVPMIGKDFKEYNSLKDEVQNVQKFRDSDYWELNKTVRQLLKANDEFKELEKEIVRITARMSQIKSLILTEQEQIFPKENMEKYAALSKRLHQRQKEWRLKK
jgi:hypothetical protein